MGAPRRRDAIPSRRRVDDDGEEEGSVAAGMDDDSLSEVSAISDADDDADAEGSDTSGLRVVKRRTTKSKNDHTLRSEGTNGKVEASSGPIKQHSFTAAMTDTEAMMNGMRITGDLDDADAMDFDDIGQNVQEEQIRIPPDVPSEPAARTESLVERRKREHEEYRKKRDEDPAFVPNRGGFFMHDHRSMAPGPNGFRPSIRGRGRARGAIGGPFSPSSQMPPPSGPTDAPWAHDLHETVAQHVPKEMEVSSTKPYPGPGNQPKPGQGGLRTPPPNRSFSKSTQIGNIQIRVILAGMQDPIVFSAVPVHQHTRLPHHRPPLRRDKPVRISLPNFPPRYIFPAMDRSFIFIPRALRPNQQGFGRGRGRGSFSTYAGLPSRRTSAYGGSNYSPSVAMSRRSSLARAASQEGIISPAGSSISRTQGMALELGKPVVRLPPSSDFEQGVIQQQHLPLYPNSTAPIVNLPQPQSYPLPQKPMARENRPATLPMHQPRPQKTVSVADIESPATLNFHPPQQQQQQPFHHQVPLQANGQVFTDPSQYPHSRHPSHPSQSGGTPLSQIPERAIHAQPFQPYPYQQPPQFYQPQFAPQPLYFYPQPPAAMQPSIAAPAFVPGQQYPYVVPTAPMPASTEATPQGTVAHESNGMVYYYDPSQLAANNDAPQFTQPNYAPPNTFLYTQPAVYYPSQ